MLEESRRPPHPSEAHADATTFSGDARTRRSCSFILGGVSPVKMRNRPALAGHSRRNETAVIRRSLHVSAAARLAPESARGAREGDRKDRPMHAPRRGSTTRSSSECRVRGSQHLPQALGGAVPPAASHRPEGRVCDRSAPQGCGRAGRAMTALVYEAPAYLEHGDEEIRNFRDPPFTREEGDGMTRERSGTDPRKLRPSRRSRPAASLTEDGAARSSSEPGAAFSGSSAAELWLYRRLLNLGSRRPAHR